MRVITPTVERLIPHPAEAHAVEIGYGDGTILAAAANFFGQVTGIATSADDDEASAKAVVSGAEFGEAKSSSRLPLENDSADFIYSTRGVVRMSDLASFQELMTETARVLKSGGVCMYWFGRMSRLPFMPPGADWWRGWTHRKLSGQTGASHLHLRMFHARRAARRAGLNTPSLSTPLHPDTSWRLFRGGNMSYVTAWKRP